MLEPGKSAEAKPSRPFRVLCIDGGGIRGLIPAVWLEVIEERLKKRNQTLSKSFDLVCGTSTGAILAAAVVRNIPMEQVIAMYEERGPSIFPRRRPPAPNLFRARYAHRELQAALEDVLGNARLSDAATRLCIPAYDIGNRHTYYFRSYDDRTKYNEIWKACLASASAPTFFPPYRAALQHNAASQKVYRYFVDGGVSANNPSGVGLAEAIALQRTRSLFDAQEKRGIQLVTLGTGSSTRNLVPRVRGRPGLLGWAPSILDVMFDGSSDVSAYIASQILDDKSYIRLQFELRPGLGNDDMDNATTDNLEELKSAASSYIQGPGQQAFESILSMLPTRPR